MYPALARGHTSQYINRLPEYALIDAWFSGRKSTKAIDSFAESCRSKKPGRCIKRIAPLLKPAYENPTISKWERDQKYLIADSYLSARESSVFKADSPGSELFQERAVFYSSLIMSDNGKDTEATTITVANISHHAIQRLLERDVARPDTLMNCVKKALISVRTIGIFTMGLNLDPDITWSYLIPFKSGAIATVSMTVSPSVHQKDDPREVASIRTFLSEDMLTEDHYWRMHGHSEAFVSEGSNADSAKAWLRKNARPYHFHTFEAAV